MADLLPVGTYVRVTPRASRLLNGKTEPAASPYVVKVVGYDMFGTKYRLSARYGGWGEWLFMDGGDWEFPDNVEAIGEEEALRVGA